MADPKPPSPKPDRRLPAPESQKSLEQQRLMMVALAVILVTLGFVLCRYSDFWLPDTLDTDDQPIESLTPPKTAPSTRHPQTRAAQKKVRALRANDSAVDTISTN